MSTGPSSVKRWLGLESLAPQKPGPTCSQTVNAQALKELVQTQPDLYLDEYAKLLGSHPSTIFYNLKKLGLTRKKTERYQERNEAQGKAFEQEIETLSPADVVYIDECGLDESIRRAYARSPRGDQVNGETTGKRTQRTSIDISSISEL